MSLRRSRTATTNTEIKVKRGRINLRKTPEPVPEPARETHDELAASEHLQSIARSEGIATGLVEAGTITDNRTSYYIPDNAPTYRAPTLQTRGFVDDPESVAAIRHMNLQVPEPPGYITNLQLTPYRNYDMGGVEMEYYSIDDRVPIRSSVRVNEGMQFEIAGYISRGDTAPGVTGIAFQAAVRAGAARANSTVQGRFPDCYYRVSIPMVSPEGIPVIICVMQDPASGVFVTAADLRNYFLFPPIEPRGRPRTPVQDLIADMVVEIFRRHCPGMQRFGI